MIKQNQKQCLHICPSISTISVVVNKKYRDSSKKTQKVEQEVAKTKY